MKKAVLILFLIALNCGMPQADSTSALKRVIDEGVESVVTSHPSVGSLVFENTHICTLTRVADRWALTASHCYKDALWGRYRARFGSDEFDIFHEPRRLRELDLVLLPINQEPRSNWEDWEQPSPTDLHIKFARFDRSKPINILSTGEDFQVRTSSKSDAAYEVNGHLLTHNLNTEFGNSGAPIVQDGKVVGVHVGYLKDSPKNLAVLTGNLDLEDFTINQQLNDLIPGEFDNPPLYVQEECVKSSSDSGSSSSGSSSSTDDPSDRPIAGDRPIPNPPTTTPEPPTTTPEPPTTTPEPPTTTPEPPTTTPEPPTTTPEPPEPDPPEPVDPGLVAVAGSSVVAVAEINLKACVAAIVVVTRWFPKLLGKVGRIIPRSSSLFKKLSSSAFRAAQNINAWIPKNKHLLGGGSQSKARFNTSDINEVRKIVAEALRSSNAMFRTNPGKPGTFRVITDLGRSIGVKGQQSVRVIVDEGGRVLNAFPVHRL